MNRERFLEILEESDNNKIMCGDRVFAGLKIISKYIDTSKESVFKAQIMILYIV